MASIRHSIPKIQMQLAGSNIRGLEYMAVCTGKLLHQSYGCMFTHNRRGPSSAILSCPWSAGSIIWSGGRLWWFFKLRCQ